MLKTESKDVVKKTQEATKILSDQSDADVFFRLSHDLLMVVGFDKQVKRLNPAWEQVFGYALEELAAQNTRQTIHREDLPKTEQILQDMCDGKLQVIEYTQRMLTTGGECLHYAWSLVSDSDKKVIYGIGRNVTSQVSLFSDMRRNEQRFNALFENTAVGILLLRTDGSILNINQQLLNRMGYHADAPPTRLKELIFEADLKDSMALFANLLEGKHQSTVAERRLKKSNGDAAWSRVACTILEISPKEQLVMALVEDIEDERMNKKVLDATEKRFKAVFDSSPSGIMITRNEGEILHANPAMAEMLQYDLEFLTGTNVFDYTYSEDRPDTMLMVQLLNNGQIAEYDLEKRYVRKDGTTFWAKTWVSLMERSEGEVVRVAIVENIDRRKKAEQKLEEKNKELMEINQELEHFAYVASHDLQEPLRTVASFIQILEKKYSHLLDEDGQQFMGFVVDGAKRMQALIRELLEYSRINRFNTDYERVDLNEVLQMVNRALKEKIDSTDAVILAENLPSIQGNKIQLTQIFQNLIDNAIKFKGEEAPEIIISVEELPGKWEIQVRDNGIGISQEYFQRIFIIFQRLHTHEEYSGTGIGLALCKKIIERHGGEIWLDSAPGGGTTFTFTIAKNLIRAVS